MMKRIYQAVAPYTDEEIQIIMERQLLEELLYLPLSVGMFHQDWRVAQNICLRVADHPNANVRANAVMGLAHTARTKGKLEKRLVKPVVLKELRENSAFRGTILDAIEDINMFMNWRLGRKHLEKGEHDV